MQEALSRFRSFLGEEFVQCEATVLKSAATATFPTTSQVLAIVQPGSTEEVQQCVKIAHEAQCPIYPISRGRNLGLGSRVPSADAVLLDLSRMNRIEEYDQQLGVLVVQPGVSFQQAAGFLLAEESEFFLPVTGGPPDGSVIGNCCERGEGVGPYGQRVDYVANLEVVLPNGELVHTGFGRYENAQAKHVHRAGVGPSIEGLFSQSNLGIVTRMSIWLTPRPAVLRPFVAQISNPDQVAGAVDSARGLLLERVVETGGIGFWNSYKVGATLSGYPWDAMEGQTPIDPVRFPAEPWAVGGAIYAASEQIADAVCGLTEARLAGDTENWNWYPQESNNAYLGVPSEQNVRSAYWRKRSGLPDRLDPDADRCGLIWMCIALPLLGESITEAIRLIDPIVREHGLEPNLGFNCTGGRCAHMYLSLIYDRDIDGADAQAVACHNAVEKQLASIGLYPYRLGLLSMQSLPEPDDAFNECLGAIRRSLDPASILSPGRYE